MNAFPYTLRLAEATDIDALWQLEQASFSTDRLSRRRFKHWISAETGILLVAADGHNRVRAYALIWCHKGTRLSRLYSLAVDQSTRGTGVGRALLLQAEEYAAEQGRLYMRLEVAKTNVAAIHLYEKLGYRVFGEYLDYYEDHSDALRMQKRIAHPVRSETTPQMPWYQQTTKFTCGPAALLMAMASQDENVALTQANELDIWREATTIYMTTGLGGTHPVGLGLAAHRRGYEVDVWINNDSTLFVEGVRSDDKKRLMTVVHQHFMQQAEEEQINLRMAAISQQDIDAALQDGYAVIVLISTYRLDGKKAPHWVAVSGSDKHCFYLHDPDVDEDQLAIDAQHVPIARDDFDKMTSFGVNRLRTAVAIRKLP
ncbi:MAG TPA: GNAT family N-acetyltransferase/peptidase C39 family protein [Pseudomonadales bacterium]|nr:GNAT family N-acetyltransferase/peptidase C39 family protein [Pseudomonadales bacterium]